MGEKGVWRWGEREIIYLSLHCHHQNDFCIKMGSEESHFNVSVGSDGQSHRPVSTNHSLFEEKGQPKVVSNRGPSAYQPTALPLDQTGSPGFIDSSLAVKSTLQNDEAIFGYEGGVPDGIYRSRELSVHACGIRRGVYFICSRARLLFSSLVVLLALALKER